ncbi:ATP-binding cassette subfamily C protein [Streptococcus gallinaceus]|uniref:ABC transporter ATP-binding protein n=1 Tax=Streptococcus gallinaceus TaxID=165758 RepID=UPI00209EBD36|nr:ABC transporter ATP-binding protein [Streptococcus gallinaceus]MCP1639373.1 ATP-binding cassette subfamily C protein [Streptococcus gallinaceus]MCP1769983.1 ATP-binding cassette subfamily C protein [Streptococcus gallinaceus]
MKSLLRYFKGYIKEASLAPLFKLLEACFELFVPLVIAAIVDQIIPHGNQGNLVAMVLLLMGLAVVGVVVALIAQYYSAKAAVGYTKQLTQDLYKKVLSLPKVNQDQLSTSSLLTRLTSDSLQIQTGINTFLRLFLRAPIVVFGALLMAFRISPRLSILFVVMIAILFTIVIVISRISSCYFATIRLGLDQLVKSVRENSLGMRVIRAFGQRNREIAGFTEKNTSYQHLQVQAGYWSALLTPATYLVVNLTLVVLIWKGQISIAANALEVGMLVALINYLLQILVELVKLVMVVTALNQTFISAQRVQEIFEQDSEDLEAILEREKSTIPGQAILVQKATFTYPTAVEPSLENIDFSLQASDFFGIIGGTGSGKSSLIQLLLRFYQPDTGRITVYKDDYSPQNLKNWRELFAFVPQKAQLFSGSIASNLTLGLSDVSQEKMWWALTIAQAKEFVVEKGGLDARVEAFGQNFSGGQRQRLTIARAILQEAPILVLDDSTSALDYLTESRLLTAIRHELLSQTLIMISQRTNSLRHANQILVLDQGQQAGLGRHEELLENCPVYQEIHHSQQNKGGAS